MQDSIYLVGGWRDGPEGRLLVPEIDRNVTNHSKRHKSRWSIPPTDIASIRINIGQKCINRIVFKIRLNVLTRDHKEMSSILADYFGALFYIMNRSGPLCTLQIAVDI